jgi:general secretion pathway protein D
MKKAILLMIASLAVWGCMILSQSYKLGNQAEINKKWDEAIKCYEQASLENPREPVYRLALLRAKISASLAHIQDARRLAAQGKKDESLKEYEIALSYDPTNRVIGDEMRQLTEPVPKKEKPKAERYEPPVKLKVSAEKIRDLKFVSASLRSIFQSLGKYAGVNFIFDEQFKDNTFSIDLADKEFEQAVNFLCLSSKSFFRIVDERTVIIIPDTPVKRLQYEVNAIKTFYLSNLNAQDVLNSLNAMLRNQYRPPNIIVDKNLNSLTIRDTPSTIRLADKLLQKWDKAKGEVIIDLEIMEVSRIKLRQMGINLNANAIGLRYNQPTSETSADSGWTSLKDIDFSKSSNWQISLPTSTIQFLESDSDTKIIAQPRLRGVGDEKIEYKVGQKVPIPQTTFTPIAAGGVSSQPLVNYAQQDVGIDVSIKPRIHFEKDVTLELDIKITSLGGTGFAGIPIISNREVKNVIRLKNGETNLLAGLLRDEERRTLKGIPGLKNVPILGSLFSNHDTVIEQTDVILTITPYIIRSVQVDEEDLKPLWVELDGISSGRSSAVIPEEEAFEQGPVPEEQEMAEQAQEEPGLNQVFLNPGSFEVPQNREFRISINIRTDQEVGNMTVTLAFNAQLLKLKEVNEGGLLRQLGANVPFLRNIDNSGGSCTIGFSSPQPNRGAKGEGSLAVLVFESTAKGEAVVSVSSISANAPSGKPVSFETNESQVIIR